MSKEIFGESESLLGPFQPEPQTDMQFLQSVERPRGIRESEGPGDLTGDLLAYAQESEIDGRIDSIRERAQTTLASGGRIAIGSLPFLGYGIESHDVPMTVVSGGILGIGVVRAIWGRIKMSAADEARAVRSSRGAKLDD